MPRARTERQRLLVRAQEDASTAWFLEILRALTGLLLCDEIFWPLDEELGLLLLPPAALLTLLHAELAARRYSVPRTIWPKSADYMHRVFNAMSDTDFLQHCRMSRAAFRHLCDLIRPNPIFHNNSTFAQATVETQAAVALERFGKYGTGASGVR